MTVRRTVRVLCSEYMFYIYTSFQRSNAMKYSTAIWRPYHIRCFCTQRNRVAFVVVSIWSYRPDVEEPQKVSSVCLVSYYRKSGGKSNYWLMLKLAKFCDENNFISGGVLCVQLPHISAVEEVAIDIDVDVEIEIWARDWHRWIANWIN